VRAGIICTPATLDLVTRVARRADAAGLWGMAIGDSPLLYRDLHVATTVALRETTRLRVGSIATNPSTRHWSVHAAAAASFEELAPGRHFIAMASGNSAVRSFGMAPAADTEVIDAVLRIRDRTTDSGPIYVTADGPRMAAAAGLVGDGIVTGIGRWPEGITGLLIRARASRSTTAAPLESWLSLYYAGANAPSDAERSVIVAMARRCLVGNLASKGVPEAYRAPVAAAWSRYDMGGHAAVGGPTPNARLFDDHPAVERYLCDRFGVRGSPAEIAGELAELGRACGLGGVLFNVTVTDPEGAVDEVAEIARLLGGP
jgi:alkanesulfonate monooxygenase SsuD/methylene tetrahydromethanopterin reductase-like flavin-dependent oxidoreductase (luciferase family)